MKKTFTILFAILFIGATQAQQQDKVGYLKTFAKAYGYVKYFHPSDEASEIDWNRFAAYGANEILKSNNTNEVITTLNNLFKPIAPGVVFSHKKQDYDVSPIVPKNISDYKPIYWQHLGVSKDMNMQGGPYMSVRINRDTEIDESAGFGNLSASINAQ